MTRLVDALGAASRTARRAGLERAAHRLRDALDAQFLRMGRPPLSVDVDGLRLHGFLRHRSSLADIVRTGATYRELFAASLRPGMTVADAGAHLGLYSLLAARGNGGAPVLAFEPDPYNLRALERNVAGSPVRIVPKALAEEPRRAVFYRSRVTIGSSLTRREGSDVETIVEVTSIDEELRGAELSSLLVKLNIEGAEPLALEGMRETLSRCEDVTLFVEINPLVLDRPQDLVARLIELAFEVFRIDRSDQSLAPLDPSAPLGKGHLLASRRER